MHARRSISSVPVAWRYRGSVLTGRVRSMGFGDSVETCTPVLSPTGTKKSGCCGPYTLILGNPATDFPRFHPASCSTLSIALSKLIDSSSSKTETKTYSVPLNGLSASTSSDLWSSDLGVLSLVSCSVAASKRASVVVNRCVLHPWIVASASFTFASAIRSATRPPAIRNQPTNAIIFAISEYFSNSTMRYFRRWTRLRRISINSYANSGNSSSTPTAIADVEAVSHQNHQSRSLINCVRFVHSGDDITDPYIESDRRRTRALRLMFGTAPVPEV